MVVQKSQKLEDQAATAALYATRSGKSSPHEKHDRIDDSSRLSSAGAATSLKYASPADLPSYPTAGLANIESSAEAAASLANAHHQDFEHWKPDTSEAATKAALLAKDYKSSELWQPQRSSAGSRAAALAAKDTRSVDVWHPAATQAGNSAAGQAMRGSGLKSPLSTNATVEGVNKALLAATGAMTSGRQRSGSSPITKSAYPDSENSAANALSAASFANKSSLRMTQGRKDAASSLQSANADAAWLQKAAVTNLPREMYTSNPPVAPEVEEKNRQAGQRAAAISMAKQMYEMQQKAIAQAQEAEKSDSHVAANYLHNRKQSVNSIDEAYQSTPQYVNLQEAAQKLAAERLAKLHDEHAAYRNYYGTNVAPQSRLSVRNRPRRRASSEGASHTTEEIYSKLSHPEMSLSKENTAQVDAKKRQKDRDLLMAAAQRNVKASMQSMDEKVFAETGRPSPTMVEDWEQKANARAKAASKARMVNHGKINIGGGKYLDQSEIDEIAAKRVQPTLDEISEKAALQRARDAELQHEEQERNRTAAAQNQSEKERNKNSKAEWKRFRDEEKREIKARKEQKKMRSDQTRSKDENEHPLANEADPAITSEDEGSIEPESTVPESKPHFDSTSFKESSKPDSATLRTEVKPIEQEPTDDASAEVQPERTRDEANETEAMSKVDPALLDPVLREPAVKEEPVSEPYHEAIHSSSDPSHAEVVATRVLNASSITDASIKDTTTSDELRQAAEPGPSENTHRDVAPDQSQPTKTPGSAGEPSELTEKNVSSDAGPKPLISTQGASDGPLAGPKSPKGESRVASWLKTKFGRRTAKSNEPQIGKKGQDSIDPSSLNKSGPEDEESHKNTSSPDESNFHNEAQLASITELGQPDSNALSESQPVAQLRRTSHSISSISGDEDATGSAPTQKQRTSSSHDEFKEAQDHLDFEQEIDEAATSTALRDAAGPGSDKHNRDSKFQENL